MLLKMKKSFLIMFLIGLIFSVYSVSALYTGTIGVNIGENVQVTIGDIPSVNVTNSSTNTSTDGGTTDVGSTGEGGGGGGSSLLSSVIKTVYNDEENETENSDSKEENENLEETTSSNFLTGFAVGFSDFAQSSAGVATFIVVGLMIVGGITFLAVKGKFKNFLPKKNVTVENNNS